MSLRRLLPLAALLVLAPGRARADVEVPLPPPVEEAPCAEGTPGCEPLVRTASPPAGRSAFSPEFRLGLWLLQEASIERTSHLSPGLRVALWAHEHVGLDGGYQFAYDREGTNRLYVTTTLHSLDLRVHYRYTLETVALTAGAGLAGYLTTISAHDGDTADALRTALSWGIPFVVGAETWVSGHPVRFETQLATRGSRLDLLFAAIVGY